MREAMIRYALAAFAAVGIGLFGATTIAEFEGTGPTQVVEQIIEHETGELEFKREVLYEAYPDPGYGWRTPTICYGSTTNVKRGQTATAEECWERLVQDVRTATAAVARLVKQDLTQAQYEALVSFTFNTGQGNLAKSTLLSKINKMQTEHECRVAAAEFDRWIYSNGKKLQGLVKRRAEERRMFEQGCAAWPS